MNTSIVQHDPVILRLMQASTALTEAKSIQQTKSILDVAAAAEIYAKRQQLGEDAIGIAHSIKIEALRKLGEMLQESPKNTGARGVGKSGVPNKNPTLVELGLDKKTSSVAQKLAELPEEAFKQVRDGHETVAKAIAAVSQTKRPGAKPVPAQPEPLNPEDDYSELDAANDKISDLQDMLAVRGAPDEEREITEKLVSGMREQIKTLTATLEAVTISRDTLLRTNAQLMNQVARQRKEIDKFRRIGEAA